MELNVTNMGAEEAGKIKDLPENTVLISINGTEGRELSKLDLDRNNSKILTVRFDDVTSSSGCGIFSNKVIDDKTSLQMVKFIEENKNKNFIVHCAAGISRSGATALYIHLFYGHKLKKDFWRVSYPNKYVIGSLVRNKLYHLDYCVGKEFCHDIFSEIF